MKTNLLKSIFISLILVMGVSNAWGWNSWNNKTIYFDNSLWASDNYTPQLLIGRYYTWGGDSRGSSAMSLTKIQNTNLWYLKNFTYSNYTSQYFIANATTWGNEYGCNYDGCENTPEHRYKYATHYTNSYNTDGNSKYNLFIPESKDNNASLAYYHNSNYSTLLNYNQTVQQHLSTNGGAYATSTASIATVTVSSYKLSNETTAAADSKTIASGSSSATCSAARTAIVTYTVESVKTGYTFVGWYDGNTQKSTNETYTYNATGAKTITARFKENTYSVTISAGNGGTVSPSGSQTIGEVTQTTVTATANDNYEFANWTAIGGVIVANNSSASTTITATADGTLTANFRSTLTYSLTVVAGNGISQVTGSEDHVTLGSKYDIKATPKTGYTFSTWTANPVANATFGSATTANTTVTVKNGSVTVTASATENMSTLTTSNKYDAGDPGYKVPTASVNSIGYETTATVTATAAGNGYTFTGWTLTNCTRTDGGVADATSITVRSNGDGKAATVVANYAEDLATSWVLKGSFVDDFKTAYDFTKKTGESTGTVAYVTLELAANTAYRFKVVNGDTWYGNNNSNEQYWIKATAENWNFYSDAGDCHMKSSVAGTYTFKIDFSGTYPKVSVYFPTAYKITYGVGTNKGTDEVTTNPSISSGSLVLASTSITFSKGDTKAGYTWKNWNSKADGTGTILGTGDIYVSSNRAGDITVYACYDLVGYTVTLDPQEGTGGTASVSAKLNNPMPEIELPTREAYDFGGYYDAEGGQGTQYYKPDGTSAMNWDKTTDATLYAHWIPTEYNITYELNGGTNHASNPKTYNITQEITLQDPTYIGHIFAGWYANAELTGDAILSISAGSTGAKTFYAKWEIGTYEITLDLQQGTGGTQTISATFGSEMPAITTPTREGYLFNGYYDQIGGKGTKYYDETGKNIKNWNKESATLYAYWIPYSQCIFFKNTLGWTNVYVYTFSNNVWYDNEDSNTKYGPGVCTKVNVLEFAKMTQINNTDIYYYILTKQNAFNYIAFSDANMNDWNEFHGNNAIYRADRNDQLPLFIPKKSQTPTTTNSTKYYSSGIWMKYNSTESGYDWRGATDENNQEQWSKKFDFTASKPGGYSFTATVEFNNTSKHYFKIHNTKGDWFGNGGTMTQKNCTDWIFGTDNSSNAQITPTITGAYNFTIYLGDGEVSVSLDYPLSVGDYRIVYKDSTQNSAHASHYIKKVDGLATQTESFFVRKDKEAQLFVQKCAAINSGIPTWNTVANTTININDLIPSNGIYNFVFTQDGNNVAIQQHSEAYTGNYYIRTDAAPGGWDSFRQEGNKMTYSSYAEQHSDITHYFCKWVGEAYTNVKFVIANEYSHCISDTLDGDDVIDKDGVSVGCLPASANVRFGWNMETNEVTRAYISGSSNVSDRFLVLKGDANLKDIEGNNFDISGLDPHEVTFDDMGNWIYQLDVQAGRGTPIRLTAKYNGNEQEFFSTSGASLIDATTPQSYKVRFIYDFKTNHLVAAWLLDDIQTSNGGALNSNMLVIRKHHDQAQQLKLNSALTNVGTAYGVMTFDKYFLNNRYSEDANIGKELPKNERKSIYERALYWVSFPFDVCIRDVFGFGEYMDTWIMEYYDGEARATNGAWVDSESYWTYMTNVNDTIKAGVGYVLCLDLDKMNYESSVWANTAEVSLYFPSAQTIGTINANQVVPVTLTQLPCSIERDNRKIYDSNWHVIGVPRFINLDLQLPEYSSIDQENVLYYYKYNAGNNTYDVAESGVETFQVMQAYMVQFAGTINWSTPETPTQLAARRNADSRPEKVSLNLELAQDDLTADKTFIQLQEEGATSDFDMNIDLTKIINAGANIYTLVGEGNIQTAGNVLPMDECEVPVGVKVDAEGEYTFRMPDGTEGMVVELIDYYTNTRTNLLLFDYTVDLSAGTCNDRFALHIQPEKSGVATDIDQLTGSDLNVEGVQKYIIDGKLIIRTAEGEVFDAQGHRL